MSVRLFSGRVSGPAAIQTAVRRAARNALIIATTRAWGYQRPPKDDGDLRDAFDNALKSVIAKIFIARTDITIDPKMIMDELTAAGNEGNAPYIRHHIIEHPDYNIYYPADGQYSNPTTGGTHAISVNKIVRDTQSEFRTEFRNRLRAEGISI